MPSISEGSWAGSWLFFSKDSIACLCAFLKLATSTCIRWMYSSFSCVVFVKFSFASLSCLLSPLISVSCSCNLASRSVISLFFAFTNSSTIGWRAVRHSHAHLSIRNFLSSKNIFLHVGLTSFSRSILRLKWKLALIQNVVCELKFEKTALGNFGFRFWLFSVALENVARKNDLF